MDHVVRVNRVYIVLDSYTPKLETPELHIHIIHSLTTQRLAHTVDHKHLHMRQSLRSGYDRLGTDITKLRLEPLSNDTRVGEFGLGIGADRRKWS
jgi:hypothetical protein